MKLKKALKIAKKEGFDCIAVDANKKICGYKIKFDGQAWYSYYTIIGMYTGSKKFEDTFRKIKK